MKSYSWSNSVLFTLSVSLVSFSIIFIRCYTFSSAFTFFAVTCFSLFNAKKNVCRNKVETYENLCAEINAEKKRGKHLSVLLENAWKLFQCSFFCECIFFSHLSSINRIETGKPKTIENVILYKVWRTRLKISYLNHPSTVTECWTSVHLCTYAALLSFSFCVSHSDTLSLSHSPSHSINDMLWSTTRNLLNRQIE